MRDTRPAASAAADTSWLRGYYFTRAAASAVWVASAFTIGLSRLAVSAVLLVAYPAWDAIANAIDARHNGGLARSGSQALNCAVSALTAVAVAVALGHGMNAVLAVFGVWAVLAGLFQLVTGVRRWKTHGAQWAMILSGAQSALAGVFFARQASAPAVPDIGAIAPYAAFGAFYFLVSAVWLTVSAHRRRAVA